MDGLVQYIIGLWKREVKDVVRVNKRLRVSELLTPYSYTSDHDVVADRDARAHLLQRVTVPLQLFYLCLQPFFFTTQSESGFSQASF